MDADDFEYHITFPSCQDLCFVNCTNPNECVGDEPVIFLLGWEGCDDETLSKYSCIYEEGGLTSVRYIPLINCPFAIRPPQHLQCHSKKLVALLYDYGLDTQPLFFHIFSHGGSLVYDLISKELQKPEHSHIKVKGCIFENAPTKVSATTILVAILYDTAHSTDSWLKKYVSGIWNLSYVSLASICLYALNLFYECDVFTTRIWQRLAREANHCPQLFIYKEVQESLAIKDFIKLRQKQGVKTAALSVETESVRDADLCSEQILSFIQQCLEN